MQFPSLLSFIQRVINRAADGDGGKTEAPPAPPVFHKDEVKVKSLLRHERFAGDAELAAVIAGKAALTKGAKGDAVQKVQQALQDMAFVLPSGADGAFGNQTAQALKNFQSAAGLPQTGELDAKTLKALDQHAPAPGQTSWSGGQSSLVPSPDLGHGKKARVVVDISQHRAFLYDQDGELTKIYGVRSGNGAKGWDTKPGVKVIDGKNNDPTSIARQLWGGSGDAFGTRLLNLSDYDLETGKKYLGKHKGQELHGTYQEESIGRDFSHGCVGLKNADIEEIFDQVKNGELVHFVE
ncbi:MAG: L,D-transpeptidase family protein [Candidatus Sericytochromatia bacterium]